MEGQALSNLGDALLQKGSIEDAQKILFNAVEVWESLRRNLGNNDLDKVSIFETQATTHTTLQEALIAQKTVPGKIEAALEIAERGRARAFVESLEKKSQLRASQQSSIQPISIAEMKKIARERNTTLVEYSIIRNGFQIAGRREIRESKIYIWVVQPDGTVTHRNVSLPLELNLSQLVEQVRAAIGVRGRSSFIISPADTSSDGEKDLGNRLTQLHELLVQPISDLLPLDPNAHVTFIPHVELFLVPFSALQDANGKYLIEQHTILTAPAIQVLDFTRQNRQRVQQAGLREALVVGNPTMPKLSKPGEQPEQLGHCPMLNGKQSLLPPYFIPKPGQANKRLRLLFCPNYPKLGSFTSPLTLSWMISKAWELQARSPLLPLAPENPMMDS